MQTFHTEQDEDGILVARFDVPNKSMNTLTKQALSDLEALSLKAKEDATIKGVVILSGKASGFCAGADLEEMIGGAWESGLEGEAGLKASFDAAFEMNRVYRLLETCTKPVAVVINGVCLGGGLELALSCHYRLAEDGPKTQLGLPEVKIGLFPGGGGSQRLPRLIGVQAALMAMSEGKSFKPKEALSAGIIHAVTPVGEGLSAAKEWILTKGDAVAPWDKKDYKIPGGGPYHPAGIQNFLMGNAIVRKQSFGNYPNITYLMRSVYEGLQVPFDTAIKIESRLFVETLKSPVAKAMIRTFFFNMQALSKGAGRPAGFDKHDPQKVSVLGAGMMGAGIAYVQALAGIETVLIDRDLEAAQKGKSHCQDVMKKAVSRGKMSPEAAQKALELITPSADYGLISGSDLVIEAVFENSELKAKVTALAEAHLSDDAVFGTNTSTIPIGQLAKASQRPENFIGIHFFSPVDKMMLVEIIVGEKTSQKSLAKAMDYVLKIKKTPIVVTDARYFYANRCFIPYTAEGMRLWAEGVAPAIIDNVGRMSGMPRGPLEMMDDVALDLLVKITSETKKATEAEGADYVPIPGEEAVAKMVEAGRLGRKNGLGFYDYPASGPKTLWAGLADFYPVTVSEAEPDVVLTIRKRLLYAQAVEAVRCFEDGVIESPREADIGSILGWGFAPWSGGIISLIDSVGPKAFLAELEAMNKAYGPRFAPPLLLKQMAEKDELFYDRFG